jgi:hypothetical protein
MTWLEVRNMNGFLSNGSLLSGAIRSDGAEISRFNGGCGSSGWKTAGCWPW